MFVTRVKGRFVDEGEKGIEFFEEELHKRVAGSNGRESASRKLLVSSFGPVVQGFKVCYDLVVSLLGERADVGQVLGTPYIVAIPRGEHWVKAAHNDRDGLPLAGPHTLDFPCLSYVVIESHCLAQIWIGAGSRGEETRHGCARL